ncbi:nucleolar protein-like protein with NOL1/NOP2/sun family putative RNA methylase domain [Babesia bigemina]|uniref:Nucleolar protein-like protein with NOL1/NOP2/sun family putative RNA methylase domain n=1 Tax=Babesia bigemina TaxID=5866 RepID=A0A061D0A9_BABBI|nr:nucleolar protein-like protein with NOL1/NOP2/sun family putative RNA methylase domain [Babesia bigemina]CDR94108.1 nucleolar protein-like protein with NOL1/NOP2/sun family putative RNA methylase domain [Babesia bigemina]|eukprot:XP_012766294.1 nucleolar protein-like protein with NOL1/NOP2/sun family putative RNA methylase domain [Babesia bigemina]
MVALKLLERNDESEDSSDYSVENDEFDDVASGSDDGGADEAEEGLDVVDAENLHGKVDMTDLSAVKGRIESICGVLSNWSSASKSGVVTKKRGAYMRELREMVSAYYGYSDELAEYFLQLFSPTEAIQLFEANERPLPMTLRVNTLKTRRKELAAALIARGANVDPVGNWSKEGLVVHSSQVPIGATPEYLAGHYMMQSAASMIPVLALGAREKVLDIAAAPGGKTTHIAQMMNNGGILYANDLNKDRCTALVANIHRLGITNTIVTNYNGLDLKGVLPPLDRVLCDAPCSGLGVISKDPSVKVNRTVLNLQQNADLQKRLLLTCIDMVNSGSKNNCVVYSTCSISVEENEHVIDHALKMRDVKLVPLGVDVGSPALSHFRGKHFHPSIGMYARRFYPHVHNLDGFFVAKLVKLSSKVPTLTKRHREPRSKHEDASEREPKLRKKHSGKTGKSKAPKDVSSGKQEEEVDPDVTSLPVKIAQKQKEKKTKLEFDEPLPEKKAKSTKSGKASDVVKSTKSGKSSEVVRSTKSGKSSKVVRSTKSGKSSKVVKDSASKKVKKQAKDLKRSSAKSKAKAKTSKAAKHSKSSSKRQR